MVALDLVGFSADRGANSNWPGPARFARACAVIGRRRCASRCLRGWRSGSSGEVGEVGEVGEWIDEWIGNAGAISTLRVLAALTLLGIRRIFTTMLGNPRQLYVASRDSKFILEFNFSLCSYRNTPFLPYLITAYA